ncbi:MAG: hypothetical protein GY826_27175, partial [Fuerstiella sp.]|nr:hypothetical protein [Fuerstiella sp.]
AIDSDAAPIGVLNRQPKSDHRFRRETVAIAVSAVLGMGILVAVGHWIHRSIHTAVRDSLKKTMQSLLHEQRHAIVTWLKTEERLVQTWARTPDVVNTIAELQNTAGKSDNLQEALSTSESSEALSSAVAEATGDDTYQFAVWNREGRLLADSSPEHSQFLGNGPRLYGAGLLSRDYTKNATVLWLPTKA